MADFSDVIIIFNPHSTGNAQARAKQLQTALAKSLPKMSVKLWPTAHAGHAITLAYDAAKKYRRPLIVSASGDGGYNEVINGALRAQNQGASPVCAVLSSGNANDHARTMQHLPLAKSITKGVVRQLDLLKVTITPPARKPIIRYAHAYIGLGLTPTVAIELNKHTLNSLVEGLIVLKSFRKLRPVVVRSDGKTVSVDSLICSTIPQMAKIMTISRAAQGNDGLFELTILAHNKKVRLIYRLLKSVFTSLGNSEHISSYSCTVLSTAPIQFDGEVMKLEENTQLEIVICPGLLQTVI